MRFPLSTSSPDVVPAVFTRAWLAVVCATAAIVVLAEVLGGEIYLLAAIAGLFVVALCVRYPAFWLSIVILFHIDILRRTEGISPGEILFAIIGFGGIGLWFLRRVLTGERIVEHRTDLLWFGFFGMVLLSAIPAAVYHVDPDRWVRWIVYFIPYFLVFPAREILRDRSALPWVAGSFLILGLWIGIHNVLSYRASASTAVYAWQLLSGRASANEPVFMVSIVLALAVFLGTRHRLLRIAALGLVVFFSLALVLTFSRGYWIGTVLAVVVFFLLVSRESRSRLIVLIGTVSVGSTIVFTLIFQKLGASVFRTITDRLSSRSLNLVLDPSLRARVAETQEMVDRISSNPLTGYGFGNRLTFYNPLVGAVASNDYGHNAYLFLWFSIGIGGLLMFLAFYGSRLLDAFRLVRRPPTPAWQPVFAGMLSIMVAMLAISVTSPQFYTRDCVLMLALFFAIMDAHRPMTNAVS